MINPNGLSVMKRFFLLMMTCSLVAACDQAAKGMNDMSAQEMDAPEII